ncbi:hypothetical protein ACIGXM_05175 [Kitasatospora sp. NPDC052896]|uniref:hypothetical protein n=1 Tax=Kitasatospora sp. NPDC052896 TaxID=3364061 RepID=UPI0037C99591
MTYTPRLRAEDRPDFGRTLDAALRDHAIRTALHERDTGPTAEQLRTRALSEQDTIARAAADEYRHYTELRAGLRQSAPPRAEVDAPAAEGPVRELLAQLHPANGGGGPWPVLTVLVPLLTAGAAVVLLLLGYALRATDPRLGYAHAVLLAGWAAAALAAGSLLVGLVGLVLTALRDSAAGPDGQDPELRAEVAEARTAWLAALRERGLLPYLLANLDAEPAVPRTPAPTPRPAEFTSPGYTGGGYGSPGFTSPAATPPAAPAEFTSPGYTSPGFTGPDEV